MNGKSWVGVATAILIPLLGMTLWFNTELGFRPTREEVWQMIDRTMNRRFDDLDRRFDRLERTLRER